MTKEKFFTIGLRHYFKKDEKQLIYSEGKLYPKINESICRNYKYIKDLFHSRGFDFCYIPILSNELRNINIANYYAPFIGKVERERAIGNDLILNAMTNAKDKGCIPPSLLFYNAKTRTKQIEAKDQYSGCALDISFLSNDIDNASFDELLYKSFNSCISEISRYIECKSFKPFKVCCSKILGILDDELYDADERFDDESRQLIQEIQERVDLLHQKGINDTILDNIFHNAGKLSRLVITKNYKIELPDYSMTIELSPLPLSVYILFLRHHEGIVFKELPDYREELSGIYQKLRGGKLSDKEHRSIINVTDPLNNSINEKCFRIREAFVSKFDERLAHRYYISGSKGKPKRITLPIDLIYWEN